MKYRKIVLTTLFATMPALASAQLLHSGDSFKDIATLVLKVINYLMQTLFALISLGIIYTTFKYINALKKGDSKTADEYKRIMIGAIIGLAVAFSLWGIITLIANTLGWGRVGIPQFTAPV